MTDNELVDDVRGGNRQAFTELMRRHQQKMYWVARRIVGSHADADDVVQEAFVKAFLSLGEFRGESSFSTWLYRITVNLSLNSLRKSHVVRYLQESELAQKVFASRDTPEEELQAKQVTTLLDRAVEELPDKQKTVFVMRFFDGLPYEEISQITKTSVGGLKANYFHALRKVQEYMKHEMEMGRETGS
jgi:RNA polymerase sigma-70 factor, ECF subfamily